MKKTICKIIAIGTLAAVGTAFGSPQNAPAGESRLRVMTYNIYRGGTMHGQPLSQTVKVIQAAKADVVGIQETRSPKGVNAEQLAQLLGWNYYVHPKNNVILTRYEIVEKMDNGIKVKLPSGQGAYIFNLHLKPSCYLPYQFLGIKPIWPKTDKPFIPHIKTEAEAIVSSKKGPASKTIAMLLRKIRSLPDQEAPVFVVGDFNEPSHLDWTEAAAKAGRHPLKVAYPTSEVLLAAGFGDAYRTIYPDEMAKPGFTWTPMKKSNQPRTHHDRIDYIYYKGMEVIDSKIIGENEENADIVVSPYPSDHRAVVATFKLPGQSSSEKMPAPKSKEIKYKSSADQSEQPAMFYAPASKTPVPLVVALHTWSGDYKQKYHKAIEQWCIQHGWAYIHPDFRGPNNRPEATGSELVVADIVSTVEDAKTTTNIDPSAVYLVGTSGGGYTALVMAGHHPELWAGVSAWVPISDLATWHAQGKHVEALEKSCGGAPGASPAVDAEYAKRSPVTYLKNAKGTTLHINAGIKDGIVPINHALLAFNELAAADDQISEADIRFFVEKRKVPPKLKAKLSDPTYGQKQPLFRRKSGNATVTIFAGGHQLVAPAATAWIQQIHNENKNGNKQDAGHDR